jgi:hypothetical protein
VSWLRLDLESLTNVEIKPEAPKDVQDKVPAEQPTAEEKAVEPDAQEQNEEVSGG